MRIDIERFWSTLERSAGIGPGRPGGLARLALSDADREMRDQFAAWCREAGLSLSVDVVGNMFGRRAGLEDHLPPVVLGSHLDTQANGGRFDGIVGVLGALEVVRALNAAAHRTRRPIEIVNWTNEEGARFSPPMVAAGAYVGAYTADWLYARTDEQGATMGEELRRIGYLGQAPLGRPFDAYLELHIEQGPELHAASAEVGIVTHGYTSHGLIVEFRGETAHTGPRAMELRRNALIAGARLLAATDDIGWAHAATGGKATGARLSAWPNRAGIVSDWAEIVCDVRHDDPRTAGVMAEAVRRAAYAAGARAGCEARILDEWRWGGRIFDPGMVALVREAAAGLRSLDLPSQAGHDAYYLAQHCPTAMIFCPCRDGITHHNEERCEPDDVLPGLRVLLRAAMARADR